MIASEIETFCHQRDINFIRDNNAMQHGDIIMEFMHDLTNGDHIITIFSKPYFQSLWCMHELLKIWQKGNFNQRTYALFADDCNLQDMSYRLSITKYWGSQYKRAKKQLKDIGIDKALISKEYEQVNMIREIYQNSNALVHFAAGRLTTPLAELQKHKYSQILDQIQMVQPIVESGELDTSQKQKLALAQQEIIIYTHLCLGENISQAITTSSRYRIYLELLAMGQEQFFEAAAQVLSAFYYSASMDYDFKHFREFLAICQKQHASPQKYLTAEFYLEES